ncbi:hypothetical protein [uncultured Treponema sp.]|uniref:hypothetical protein n=1 Tax=uncultured Treponema sp. TaxID=162155 RepID=UPI0025D063AE|nr:hypothetical protein [uncultured Treponema sp.]
MNRIEYFDDSEKSRFVIKREYHKPYFRTMDYVVESYLTSIGYDNLTVVTVAGIKEMYPVLVRPEKERSRGVFSRVLSSFSIQYAFQ